MNYLDQPISIYKNVRGIVGRTCTLRSFLFSTKYKERILEIRAIEDKKARDILKIQLPQATISGVFKSHRRAENLLKHSGLICIDIDDKDNRHILNFDDLKKLQQLGKNQIDVTIGSALDLFGGSMKLDEIVDYLATE